MVFRVGGGSPAQSSPIRAAKTKGFQVYNGEKVQICLGDFFEFDGTSCGTKAFERVWDRGSLVAIEPALRER